MLMASSTSIPSAWETLNSKTQLSSLLRSLLLALSVKLNSLASWALPSLFLATSTLRLRLSLISFVHYSMIQSSLLICVEMRQVASISVILTRAEPRTTFRGWPRERIAPIGTSHSIPQLGPVFVKSGWHTPLRLLSTRERRCCFCPEILPVCTGTTFQTCVLILVSATRSR